jgi:hypothetical protein
MAGSERIPVFPTPRSWPGCCEVFPQAGNQEEKVMAEKVGAADKPAKEKKVPKTHNLSELTKKLEPFLKEITKAYDAMEEDHGSHVLSINHKFEAISEKIGFPKALIRTQVARIRRAKKAEEQLKEMTVEELEEEISLREGFAGTAFGKYVDEDSLDRLREQLKVAKAAEA